MIIRTSNGELLKINKYDYPNDMIYYEKIMNMKKEVTKEHENRKNEITKTSTFFLPKKVDKNMSSSMQSICDFVNIDM
jgi:hypothetical protein